MSVSIGIDQARYYESYTRAGTYLNLMNELLRQVEIKPCIVEHLRSKGRVRLLMLGSATVENVYQLARIDQFLRPGQERVEKDEVVIIDLNLYPLHLHQELTRELDKGLSDWSEEPYSTPEFPLPSYTLAQADMRELPFTAGSMDVVVSDFTFNFLSDCMSIEQAFSSVANTMPTNGIMLMTVRCHMAGTLTGEPVVENLSGNTLVHCFSAKTYIEAARKFGLEVSTSYMPWKELFCIFEKV